MMPTVAEVLDDPEAKKLLRGTQIIVAALCMGVMTFTIVSVVVTQTMPPVTMLPFSGFMLLFALGFALMAQIASAIVTRFTLKALRRRLAASPNAVLQPSNAIAGALMLLMPMAGSFAGQQPQGFDPSFMQRAGDIAHLLVGFRTLTIVTAALLEGPAFLSLVSYIIERHPGSLILAGLLFCALLLKIPTRDKLESGLTEQLRLLEEERGMTSQPNRAVNWER
ncbi:MAG TPA: hypothetical protein VGP72_34015 [Planctomycetota bacterium]|jgi:uncharacterized membrane protein YvlD (DUF360 family)